MSFPRLALAGGSVPVPLHPVVSVKMWLPLGLCGVQDSRRHPVGGSDMIWEWREGRGGEGRGGEGWGEGREGAGGKSSE